MLRVGAGRRDAMRSPWLGDGSRAPSPVQLPPLGRTIPLMGLWVAGRSSVETIRDQLQRAIAAAGTPSETRPGLKVRSISDRSTQPASQERWRAGTSCRRRVGFRPEGLGRVSVATLHNVGEVLRLSVGPGPRPTRAEVATQPVRPVPRSTACSECAPESRPGVVGLPASVLCGTAHAHRHSLGVIQPGRH